MDGVDAETKTDLPVDCPAALRRVLLTCLNADPQQRWATGTQLAQLVSAGAFAAVF